MTGPELRALLDRIESAVDDLRVRVPFARASISLGVVEPSTFALVVSLGGQPHVYLHCDEGRVRAIEGVDLARGVVEVHAQLPSREPTERERHGKAYAGAQFVDLDEQVGA